MSQLGYMSSEDPPGPKTLTQKVHKVLLPCRIPGTVLGIYLIGTLGRGWEEKVSTFHPLSLESNSGEGLKRKACCGVHASAAYRGLERR